MAKTRTIELASSRPQLLKLMGPSTRQCQTGEILNFKLMFINRMDNRRQTPIGAGAGKPKPIRMFMYVNEAEAEENDSGIDNTTAEEEPD